MSATNALNLSVREVEKKRRRSLPMTVNTFVYGGSFVGVVAATGAARPLVAGDVFAGLALRNFDNTTAAPFPQDLCETEAGLEALLTVTGLNAATQLNALVYASDDQTPTLTAQSNSLIGIINEIVNVTAGTAWVRLYTANEIAGA